MGMLRVNGRSVMLIGLLLLVAETMHAQATGMLQGTVVLDEGSAGLRGATVFVIPLDPQTVDERTRTTEAAAISNESGRYLLSGLKPGAYLACVVALGSDLVRPCDWGLGVPVSVQAGAASDVELRVPRGRTVEVRVADPNAVLEKNENKVTGAHILVGVWRGTTFIPARLSGTSQASRVYSIVVPFNTQARLDVRGERIHFRDAEGAQFAGQTSRVNLNELSSSSREPKKFDFVVSQLAP